MWENKEEKSNFFQSAFSITGSASGRILFPLGMFFSYSIFLTLVHKWVWVFPEFNLTPFEVCGAFLGVLLVFRTNAGYDRWWEARKIWGGVVNQSRNLAIGALSYGPKNTEDMATFLRLLNRFPNATKERLRKKDPLNGGEEDHLQEANFLSLKMSDILSLWRKSKLLSEMEFYTLDIERKKLIDYLGACERILKTPMPLVYAIKVRRFLLIFILLVPAGIVFAAGFGTPFITLLVAYPLLGLDQIGRELQNPFSKEHLSHLPLDAICNTIEKDILSLEALVKQMGEDRKASTSYSSIFNGVTKITEKDC